MATFSRPAPIPLPRAQQAEFEALQRAAAATSSGGDDPTLHPDARKPLKPDFEGDVNPQTGEQGGPKQEPVKQWRNGEGDWSFKGRVSDF
ncbi:Protein fmp21, mitochondrial [Mycena kentingensis (nom. inval.)]|nr:Protein fmp21, mitochondrial [Mycena kentingensis (nom. inval.)]